MSERARAAESGRDRELARAAESGRSTQLVPTGNTFDKYATTNPIERRMMAGFLGALDAMLDGVEASRVLEIGAGEGEVLARVATRFPHAAVIGCDLADDDLAREWHQGGHVGIFADATRLPFPDDSFDLVLAIEVLEHIPRPERALAEIARVCSATLVASVPMEPVWRIGNVARGRYVRDLGNTPGHVNHWGRRGFRSFVASRFAVEVIRSPLPWTMLRARTR